MRGRAPLPDAALEIKAGGPTGCLNGFLTGGMDEVGRGALAGPVTAAIVCFDFQRLVSGDVPAGIRDSKQLRPEARESLCASILACAQVGLGEATTAEIEERNILQATFLAMRRACMALSSLPSLVFVDGNALPGLPCPAQAVIQGDALCLSIAAASIVAKVTRDRQMRALALAFPQYGWERNAGYGTSQHLEAIRRFGPTPHHRMGFAPLKQRQAA
jgi:ribonuclease HII